MQLRYKDFQKYINGILLSLTRKVVLPDMEFLLNMGDWPQSPKVDPATRAELPPLPIFSWCGSSTHYDMVLPTYKLVQAVVFGTDVENVQEVDWKSFETGGDWAAKTPAVYFRGRPSNPARVAAHAAAKAHPDWDVKISANQMNYYPNEKAKAEHARFETEHGKKAKREPFHAAFQNKYQLSIDGTVAAYRMPALLAGNAVVMKQQSNYYEHFYSALAPWQHYIPLSADVSDLPNKLQWARDNDRAAEQIGRRARLFARQHLRVEDVYCYHLMALSRFAALQKFNAKVHNGMSRVDDKKTNYGCACPPASPSATAPRSRVKAAHLLQKPTSRTEL